MGDSWCGRWDGVGYAVCVLFLQLPPMEGRRNRNKDPEHREDMRLMTAVHLPRSLLSNVES